MAQNPPLRNCLAGGHSPRGSQQEGVSVKVWGPGVDRGRDGAGGEGTAVSHLCTSQLCRESTRDRPRDLQVCSEAESSAVRVKGIRSLALGPMAVPPPVPNPQGSH